MRKLKQHAILRDQYHNTKTTSCCRQWTSMGNIFLQNLELCVYKLCHASSLSLLNLTNFGFVIVKKLCHVCDLPCCSLTPRKGQRKTKRRPSGLSKITDIMFEEVRISSQTCLGLAALAGFRGALYDNPATLCSTFSFLLKSTFLCRKYTYMVCTLGKPYKTKTHVNLGKH